jgi:hypothetical protein
MNPPFQFRLVARVPEWSRRGVGTVTEMLPVSPFGTPVMRWEPINLNHDVLVAAFVNVSVPQISQVNANLNVRDEPAWNAPPAPLVSGSFRSPDVRRHWFDRGSKPAAAPRWRLGWCARIRGLGR